MDQNSMQLAINLQGFVNHIRDAADHAQLIIEALKGGEQTADAAASFAAMLSNPNLYLQGKSSKLNGNGKRPATADSDDEAADGKQKRKRTTKPKDPNAPKRPASSYLLFQNHIRKELKAKNPDINNADLLGQISKIWGTMAPEKKVQWEDQNKVAKEKYAVDKAAYDLNPIPMVEGTVKVKKPRAKRTAKSAPAVPDSPVAAAAITPAATEEEDESEDEEETRAVARPTSDDEDDEEEDDEEEEEEEAPIVPPKKSKKAAPVEKEKEKKKSKKSTS